MRVHTQKQSRHQQETLLRRSQLTQHTIINQLVPVLPHASDKAHKVGLNTPATNRFAHDFSLIPVHSKASVMLQRKCACGSRCPRCQDEQDTHEQLQTKRVQANNSGETVAPPIVHEVLHSSGQPLDITTRGFMESRFGHDFSHVRVHTDSRAAESARAVNAIAYTVGRNIVFGAGHYEPASSRGRHLLAHELTHVTQQGEGSISSQLMTGPSDDRHEQEAEKIARDASGMSSAQHSASEVKLQRVPDEEDTMAEEEEDTESAEAGEQEAEIGVLRAPLCTNIQRRCSVCRLPLGGVGWASKCTDQKKPYIYTYGNMHYECSPSLDSDKLKNIRNSADCKTPPKNTKQQNLTKVSSKGKHWRRFKRWLRRL